MDIELEQLVFLETSYMFVLLVLSRECGHEPRGPMEGNKGWFVRAEYQQEIWRGWTRSAGFCQAAPEAETLRGLARAFESKGFFLRFAVASCWNPPSLAGAQQGMIE